MHPDQKQGAFCPIISETWLEERFGSVAADYIMREIEIADSIMPANDMPPIYKAI